MGLVSASVLMTGVIVVAPPASAAGGLGTSGPECVEVATDQFKPMLIVDASADADPNLTTVEFYHGTNVLNFTEDDHVVYTLVPNETKVFQFDLSAIAPGSSYYFFAPNTGSEILEYFVPDCNYSPNWVSVQYTEPTCFDGVRDNHMLATSLNPGFANELYDLKVNHVSNPEFPMTAPAGETVDLGNVIPSDAPPGTYLVELFNKSVPLFSTTVTVVEPCVAVSPSDFSANLNPQAVADDGTLIQSVEFGNFSEASRVVSIWLDDALVHTMNVASGDVQSYIMTIPRCQPYNVKVDFGFPEYTLDVVEPAFGCESPPVRTSGPTVVGPVFKVGSIIKCPVTYTSSSGAVTPSYVWKRGTAIIAGATKSSYTLTSLDLGKRMTCGSGASNAAGSIPVAYSAASAVVALGPALKVRIKPSIAGTSSPGKTLTCKVGSWTPAATSYKCQWQVLKSGKYVNISRATAKTYKVPKAYDNKYLRVVVTALKTGYNKGVYASARVYI